MSRIAVLFSLICVLAAPLRAGAETPVTVFAAASLRGALEEIAAAFPAPLSLAYGGSGTMARQVAAGAPADVVVLASSDWMDWLEGQGRLNATPQVVARNRLVLIAPEGAAPISEDEISERLGDSGRLAMGQREAVPAGVYAQQWMQQAGLWDSLQVRLAETDNVRAALALVARGDAPLGVVYASDAQAEPEVRVVLEISDETHDPITYPAAALTPEGAALVDFLLTDEAQAILADHGFRKADHGS